MRQDVNRTGGKEGWVCVQSGSFLIFTRFEMLEVVDLECMRGDRRLLTGLSFKLEPGELLHLHGHNGSGKTTLMRTVCGLIQPTEGEIRWDGEDIREQSDEFNRDLVYIGHKNGIKDDLNGIENLRICSVLDGIRISEQQAWDALEKMGLRGHEDLPARVLSQGQKRRVALARLLTHDAKLWILDEPFTALDKAAVEFLQSVIRDHVAGGGMVILTTHQDVSLTQGHARQLQLGWKGEGDV
ncbi:MAG: cytochrome c biogenesis heme-transporting ATPase CcmA [Candidatus Sedimenticola sp. 1PA]